MSTDWARCSADRPCRKCGKPDWCQISRDGTVAMCMRNAEGAESYREIDGGSIAYFHRLAPRTSESRPVTAVPTGELADADTRHAVYSALLSELSLFENHRLDLLRRKAPLGFSGKYASLPNSRSKIIERLRKKFPDDVLLSVPGFVRREDSSGRAYITIAGRSGLLIAVRDDIGRIVGVKIRIDDAAGGGGGKYRWLSSKCDGGPGPSTPAHCPLGLKGPAIIGRVTEGPLKADIANSLSGLPTIGADSASNWRPAVPMLQRLGATTARLAWDADVITNPKVGQALVKFAAALKEAGIAVEVETWPASAGKGIDDLLAAGGTTEVLAGEEAEKFLERITSVDAGGTRESPASIDVKPMDPLSILVPDSHTDLGNGRRLIRAHGPDLRYVHPWKKWLVWDGRKWREDNTAEADRRCKAVADGLYIEARKLVHDIDRAVFDRALGFARFSSSSTAIHRMQTCASSEPGVPILPEQLDAQHWLLSCSNGIVDLRTGQLRPHDRGDLLTKSSPVAFDPAATCPTWERFILQIVASEAVARFLQRLCGYWATGIVRDQILPIFYGSGANGKTTFLNAVMSVIGADFCMKAPTTAAASPGRAVSAL